ncbi:ABC transporter substrate-binding protein [Spirulina sp. 06S082]|uniref:ABC transporter substrate-binding protein n=1 Tax=Spirulina sp. 06S082 TaxID=3110248 RepID=UPI002B218093|nr:ABC transporter substrate-binding protein [Spirulina sp. 06S082]MEA5467795.1 ABC transporter substrate-binding protein [Spirulina sp. 06S082]
MKIALKSASIATLLATMLLGCGQSPESTDTQSSESTTTEKFVAITQIVEHPALDATRDGVKDELAEAGLKEGENLKWQWESAQGNPSTAAQIASKFVGDRPDVIVAIATPSAQAIISATKEIPVIFTAVTDPIGAKLVENLEKPGELVTGVTDLSPIGEQLDLIKEITPEVKRVGVLYSAGESNSVSLVELLKKEAISRNLEIVEATATQSSNVATAAQSLIGKVDAIYVPTDNTIVSALEAAIQIATENKIPLYAGDTDSVERGAIAALSFNYYDVGRQTGKIVLEVLEGKKPGDIPVQSVEKLQLFVNLKAAEAMGVEIPESVRAKAEKVIQ